MSEGQDAEIVQRDCPECERSTVTDNDAKLPARKIRASRDYLVNPFQLTRRVEKTDNGFAAYVQPPAFINAPEVRVDLSEDQYRRYCLWLEGDGPIQRLLGDVSKYDREKLITGLDDKDAFHDLVAPQDQPGYDSERRFERVQQATTAAHEYLLAGIADIDKLFGGGTARAHPELVTAYAQIAAINAGAERVAEALDAYRGDLHTEGMQQDSLQISTSRDLTEALNAIAQAIVNHKG